MNLELISLNIWHIVAAILNLLILYLIVRKFLFQPVQNILAERQKQVDTLYSEAETAQEAANAARAEYEQKLDRAEEEAEVILQNATVRAERTREKILTEAAEKASEKLRKADADIAQEKKKAMHEIKNEISGMSVDIAEKMLEHEIREEDHRKLIDSFIDTL